MKTARLNLLHNQRRYRQYYDHAQDGIFSNIVFVVDLDGGAHRICVDALKEAIVKTVQRHSVLGRLSAANNPRFFDLVEMDREEILDIFDIRLDVPVEDADDLLRSLGKEYADIRHGFDCHPVWRLALITDQEGRTSIVFSVHHLIADARSVRVFFKDLVEGYRSLSEGGKPRWNSLSVPYNEFVDVEQRDVDSNWKRTMEYWAERKRPISYVPSCDSTDVGSHCFTLRIISEAAMEQIKRSANEAQVSRGDIILASYSAALSKYASAEHESLRVLDQNCRIPKQANYFGNFCNFIEVPVRSAEDVCLTDTASTFREDLERGRAHFMPYWEVVRHLSPDYYVDHYGSSRFEFNLYPVMMNAIASNDLLCAIGRLDLNPPPHWLPFDIGLTVSPQKGDSWFLLFAANIKNVPQAKLDQVADNTLDRLLKL